MRELTFIETGKVEWRERPAPRIESAQAALVRPLVVARCDVDHPIMTGEYPVQGTFGLGHECVAEVIEIGEAVRGVRIGELVSVPFQISCGVCIRCVRGHTGACSAVPARSMYGLGPFCGRDWGGALADVMLVPFADAMLVPLPPGPPLWLYAGACDNVADGYRCVARPLEDEPGANVLVVGGLAASIGLYAVCAARALGASEVVYVDDSPERNAIAERLGARVIESEPREDLEIGRFAITVDACSKPAGLRLALAATDCEGTCTSAGMYLTEVPFPLTSLYMRGIRFLTGRTNSRAVLPQVLARIASSSLQIATVVPRRVAWEEAAEAWLEPATKLIVERS